MKRRSFFGTVASGVGLMLAGGDSSVSAEYGSQGITGTSHTVGILDRDMGFYGEAAQKYLIDLAMFSAIVANVTIREWRLFAIEVEGNLALQLDVAYGEPYSDDRFAGLGRMYPDRAYRMLSLTDDAVRVGASVGKIHLGYVNVAWPFTNPADISTEFPVVSDATFSSKPSGSSDTLGLEWLLSRKKVGRA